jgi:hypothetical protein
MGHDFYGCSCFVWCLSNGQYCVNDRQCCAGVCDTGAEQCGLPTPLLLSLDGTRGFELTAAADGVRFDINADGHPEQVAWTVGRSRVAFLAMDRNGNGTVDDGAELFGNVSLLSDGARAENGFQALADLDENHDGVVDRRDRAFRRLLVWVDPDHDGLSDPSELRSLSEASITALFTDYRESRRTDRNGNEFRYVGRAMMREDGHRVSVPMVDVMFRVVASPPTATARIRQLAGPRVDFCK